MRISLFAAIKCWVYDAYTHLLSVVNPATEEVLCEVSGGGFPDYYNLTMPVVLTGLFVKPPRKTSTSPLLPLERHSTLPGGRMSPVLRDPSC